MTEINQSDLAWEVKRLREKYKSVLETPDWMQSNLVLVEFLLRRRAPPPPEVQAGLDAAANYFKQLEADEAAARETKGDR